MDLSFSITAFGEMFQGLDEGSSSKSPQELRAECSDGGTGDDGNLPATAMSLCDPRNEEDGTDARFDGVASVVGTIVPQSGYLVSTLRVVYATFGGRTL